MGARSSVGNIRNINWAMGMRELFADSQYEKQWVQEQAQFVRDSMTQAEYDAWWAQTPDDNDGFRLAVISKVSEIKKAALSGSVSRDAITQ